MRRIVTVSLSVFVLCMLLVTQTVAAETFTTAQGIFSVTLPDGFSRLAQPNEGAQITYFSAGAGADLNLDIEMTSVLGNMALFEDEITQFAVQWSRRNPEYVDMKMILPIQGQSVNGQPTRTFETTYTDRRNNNRVRALNALVFRGSIVVALAVSAPEARFADVMRLFEATLPTVNIGGGAAPGPMSTPSTPVTATMPPAAAIASSPPFPTGPPASGLAATPSVTNTSSAPTATLCATSMPCLAIGSRGITYPPFTPRRLGDG